MAKYDKQLDRYYLEEGDPIVGNSISLEYKKGDYVIVDLTDADLKVWVEEDEKDYSIHYAWDLPKNDPNYGKAYFEKQGIYIAASQGESYLVLPYFLTLSYIRRDFMYDFDIFLKDEGEIGSLFFHTEKAKKLANEHGLKNMYGNFEIYRVDLDYNKAKEIAEKLKQESNLKVVMEY